MQNLLSKLTCKLMIFKKESISDEAGGFNVSWHSFLTLFSNYSYANNKHIFITRYSPEIKVGMKILAKNSFYKITQVIENKRKKSLKLLTEEDIKIC